MKRTFLFSFFSLLLTVNVFTQVREISREDYYEAYREANKKSRTVDIRRETSKTEFLKDGKLNKTIETITENVAPDRWRFVVLESSDKGKTKSNLIKIGETYYCQKNEDEWKKTISGCTAGWASGLTNVINSQFFFEKIKEAGESVQLYREYTLHKQKDETKKEVLWYWESKYWVNDDGKLRRIETERGLKEINQVWSKEITTYEYNPKNLKIEAPIK